MAGHQAAVDGVQKLSACNADRDRHVHETGGHALSLDSWVTARRREDWLFSRWEFFPRIRSWILRTSVEG